MCFVALAVENVLLYVDNIIVPDTDLSVARASIALAGLLCLVLALALDGET